MIYQYSKNIFEVDNTCYTFCKPITDLSVSYKHQLGCSIQSFITANKHLLNSLLIIFQTFKSSPLKRMTSWLCKEFKGSELRVKDGQSKCKFFLKQNWTVTMKTLFKLHCCPSISCNQLLQSISHLLAITSEKILTCRYLQKSQEGKLILILSI